MNKQKGFTLMELLVVVLVVGVLSAIALPNYRRSVERSRVAEVQTLLRSIYDSCERRAWEHNLTSCLAALADSNDPASMKFGKMDVMIKGTYQDNGKTLVTENFRYSLTSTGITATAIKGDYQGSVITFNGGNFSCTPGASGEAAKACEVWGTSVWNR